MEVFLLIESIDRDAAIITARNRKGEQVILTVSSPWNKFLSFIKPLQEIAVKFDENYLIDEHGYMILEPFYLIPVTSVVDAIQCPRKVYVSTMGGRDIPNKDTMIRITEGNALHDVFSLKLTTDLELEEMIPIILDGVRPDLVTQDIDEDKIRNYLFENGKPITQRLNIKGFTEQDVQHWRYGIHGKFDGLVNRNILELKSSKIPDGNPYFSHNSQINIYQAMMQERGEFTGKLIYASDNNMRFKPFYEIEPKIWLEARNWAYLIRSGKYTPSLLRGNDARSCRYCFQKDGCIKLCAGLETQRDCDDCTLSPLCDKKEWESNMYEYYTHFSNALFAEEYEETKTQKMMAQVGFKSGNVYKQIVRRGYGIATLDKQSQILVNGKYEVIFTHDSKLNRFRRGDHVRAFDR